jgi:hypothetical protein
MGQRRPPHGMRRDAVFDRDDRDDRDDETIERENL